MNPLIDAYRRFRAGTWPGQRDRLEQLAENGQRPSALVVSCIDSRIDPAVIFDAQPGEMLVVRNVANLVPPYAPDSAYHGTSAALEFGVRVLEVPNLIILGHSACGGARTLLEGAPANARDFVSGWMSIAESARVTAQGEANPVARQLCCEQEIIRLSLKNLRTFPWISGPEEAGMLKLHGAWFDINTGTLEMLGTDGRFAVIADR